jgi:hypothetical protein
MKSRPLPVIIVSLMFIITGCAGFVYHLKELFEPNTKLYEFLWVEFIRILALVCGILLLIPTNWARWLAIAWLFYHILISAFHSTSEMISHIILLVLVFVLLYLPQSAAFFQKKNQR